MGRIRITELFVAETSKATCHREKGRLLTIIANKFHAQQSSLEYLCKFSKHRLIKIIWPVPGRFPSKTCRFDHLCNGVAGIVGKNFLRAFLCSSWTDTIQTVKNGPSKVTILLIVFDRVLEEYQSRLIIAEFTPHSTSHKAQLSTWQIRSQASQGL
ncbi:hypothetical protein BH23PLA1_BH23PLA1_20050 [soil metagenome]